MRIWVHATWRLNWVPEGSHPMEVVVTRSGTWGTPPRRTRQPTPPPRAAGAPASRSPRPRERSTGGRELLACLCHVSSTVWPGAPSGSWTCGGAIKGAQEQGPEEMFSKSRGKRFTDDQLCCTTLCSRLHPYSCSTEGDTRLYTLLWTTFVHHARGVPDDIIELHYL